MELLRMSMKERDRLKVINQLDRREVSQGKAAEMLGLSVRQVRRVLARWRRQGDRGLIHGNRDREPPNKIAPERRQQALERIKARYEDHGPTLASEFLAGDDPGLEFSRETVRRWMIEAHIWQARPGSGHRRRRDRRDCFGELVQMDTSIHDWFEDGGQSALVALIDDATGRVRLRFYQEDTTRANMDAMRRWIECHGRPVAFYVDFAGHFKQPARRGQRRDQHTHTQIQRALDELLIKMINAHSPQAKGRVERLFGTMQDRLIKTMRREGIKSIEAANRFVEDHYNEFYSRRFGKKPRLHVDAHRCAQGLELDAIFNVQQTRCVGRDLTIHFRGRIYQIEGAAAGNRLACQRVIVEERLDGTLRVRFGEQYLNFREIVPVAPAVQAALAGDESPPDPNTSEHPHQTIHGERGHFRFAGNEDIFPLR